MFGQKGRYTMLEIKSPVFKKSDIEVVSFILGAISSDSTINAKRVYGTDGGLKRFDTLTGVLPNGNLIGVITTYRDNNGKEFEKFREMEFVVTPDGECEAIGYSPLKASRLINPREIDYIKAACLDFGFPIPSISRSVAGRKFRLIDLKKIFE